jgi:hypothetical protein
MKDQFNFTKYILDNPLLKEEVTPITRKELVMALQPLLQIKSLGVTPKEINNLSFLGNRRRLQAIDREIQRMGLEGYFGGVVKDDGYRFWTLDAVDAEQMGLIR